MLLWLVLRAAAAPACLRDRSWDKRDVAQAAGDTNPAAGQRLPPPRFFPVSRNAWP